MKDLAERMQDADWWYDYSDDGAVRQRGAAEIRGILNDLRELNERDPEAARSLWQDHAPKEWFPPRFFEPSPEQRPKAIAIKVVALYRASPRAEDAFVDSDPDFVGVYRRIRRSRKLWIAYGAFAGSLVATLLCLILHH
jgi:hypothetical protein